MNSRSCECGSDDGELLLPVGVGGPSGFDEDELVLPSSSLQMAAAHPIQSGLVINTPVSSPLSGLVIGASLGVSTGVGGGVYEGERGCLCCPLKVEGVQKAPVFTRDVDRRKFRPFAPDPLWFEGDGMLTIDGVTAEFHMVQTVLEVTLEATMTPPGPGTFALGCSVKWEEKSNRKLAGDAQGRGAHNSPDTWRDRVPDFEYIAKPMHDELQRFLKSTESCNGHRKAVLRDIIKWPSNHFACLRRPLRPVHKEKYELNIEITLSGPGCADICKGYRIDLEKACDAGNIKTPWKLTKANLKEVKCRKQ